MFVYLACIVYGWLLLQKGNELANYYSSTSFSADSSFVATRSAAQMVQKSVQKGGKAAVKAAGAVKDRIQTHKDRAAARTYERDQQARAVAASGAGRIIRLRNSKRKLRLLKNVCKAIVSGH